MTERRGPHDLSRFVAAQDEGGTFETALGEIARGRKRTHWMWFVLPQLAGLGVSPTARLFAIASLDEARAYLAHPVLGPRLRAATDAVLASPERDPVALLGPVDAVKLRSSMTLFTVADPSDARFAAVLRDRFDGPDAATLALLGDAGPAGTTQAPPQDAP